MTGFVYKGIRKHHDSEEVQKIVMLNVFLSIGMALLVIMGTIALLQVAYLLCAADFILAGIFFSLLFYLHRTGNESVVSLGSVSIVTFFFFYLFFIGGVNSTAFMWLYTFPLFSLFLLGGRRGLWAITILFSYCVALLVVDVSSDIINVYDLDFAMRFVPSYLAVCILSCLVENSRSQTRTELELARNQLEKRVFLRTKELEGVNRNLKFEIEERKTAEKERAVLEDALLQAEKMESLGRLAGGVAHDLNNVLSGIVSYPELLLLKLPKDSEMSKPLKNIINAGKRAAAIVDDLLSLARRGISTKETINLNDAVTSYLKSLEFVTLKDNNPNVEMTTRLSADLSNLSGSTVHLEKMLSNLIVNSYEAIPQSGHILITTENVSLDSPPDKLNTLSTGDFVVLKIEDSGVGINQEDLNKIFEPFYSSKILGHSGTGLGMTVVWGTVTDHKGCLDISSTPGSGTTVTVYFPALSGAFEASAPASHSIPQGDQEKILVVDDAPEQRKVCKSILSSLGYRVKTVSSGEEAIEYLKEYGVELVLLDMLMEPGMDGLETYRNIKEMQGDLPVLIVSGYCENDRVDQAFSLGVRGLIKKPYTVQEIASKVKKEFEY
jgi:two-component system, cell cycle sensor histidine kinase and response regulator CckA